MVSYKEKIRRRNIRQKICYHPSVIKMPDTSKFVGIENPISCDYCGLVFECDHDWELDDRGNPYCCDCGYEPDNPDVILENYPLIKLR